MGAKNQKYPASWVGAATVYSVALLWLMTAFRDDGLLLGGRQKFFTESLILAQDERWRRA